MAVYQHKAPNGTLLWYVDCTWKSADRQQAPFRRPAKDEKQRNVKSRTAAEQSEFRMRTQSAAGTFELEERESVEIVTLGDFRERYFRGHITKVKPSTQYSAKWIWNHHFPIIQTTMLTEIDASHLAGLASSMRDKDHGPKTINNALSAAALVGNRWRLPFRKNLAGRSRGLRPASR